MQNPVFIQFKDFLKRSNSMVRIIRFFGMFIFWKYLVNWMVLFYNLFRTDQWPEVTSMLVTDVGDRMCWWQVWDVGDRFRMLVNDLIHWENHQHNKKVAKIMILIPGSQTSHHQKVTNITMSLTSLWPFCW